MPIGWYTTLDEAETYFSTERLDTTVWDALTVTSAKNQKTAVLNMAYNRLYHSGQFELPTYVEASAAQLITLQKAQAEMAYYLALHLADEDRRKGLHAQGVVGANIVGETYVRFASDTMDLRAVPIPPIVYGLLAGFVIGVNDKPFYASDIDRDENKGANEDVTDF